MGNLTDNLSYLDSANLPTALSSEATTRAAADAAAAAAAAAHAVAETSARTTAIDAEAAARAAAVNAEAAARAAAITSVTNAVIAAAARAEVAVNTASLARAEAAVVKTTGGTVSTDTSLIPDFANDAAAQAGGVKLGEFYRTGSTLKVLATTNNTPPPTPSRNPVFTGNITTAVLGAATTAGLTGLLANETFTYSVIQNNPPTYTPRSSPFLTATANGSGAASFPATLVATGDFVQARFTNPTGQVNSAQVTTTNTSGNGGTGTTSQRGRPQIAAGTIKTEIGTFMRGATMALDEIGSLASTYAKNRANWTLFRSLGLNIVRLPFSLSYVGVSLSAQLAEMDVVVANAAATGMYVMPMFDWDYGQSNYAEMLTAWPVIADRYKDATHVLFEMQNEPHWNASEHTSDELDAIAAVYAAMHTAAPNTLIGVLTPASVDTSTGILSAASALVARGVDIGTKGFLTFHAYGSYSRTSVQAIKAARPCMLTETTSGGPSNNAPPNNEQFIIGEMERSDVAISWMMLAGRYGEISNTDTPYSNDQTTMTDRILPNLRAAGITWTPDPLSTATSPPVGGAPEIISLTGNTGEAVIGAPVTMTVTAVNTTTVNWVAVNANWTWYTGDTQITLNGSGVATFQWTPRNPGDRVGVWPTTASGSSVFSDPPIPAQTTGGTGGGGTTLPVPNAGSYFENFSNNNGGTLDKTWGNRAAVSYSGGIMRIAAVPGAPGDAGACGVMGNPYSASTGFGYGLFEIRCRFFGGGPGPCGLLWAADDSWPRAEEDMGEIAADGTWYTAHHWDAGGGQNAFEVFSYKDAFPARGDLPRGQWVTIGCLIKPGYLEYFVDVGNGLESIGSTTNNVTPMFSDGGVNRVFGLMHRGDRLDTAIEGDWVRWTSI